MMPRCLLRFALCVLLAGPIARGLAQEAYDEAMPDYGDAATAYPDENLDERSFRLPDSYTADLIDQGDPERSDYYGLPEEPIFSDGCQDCMDAAWVDQGAEGWFADVEALFLHRNRARSNVLAYNRVIIVVAGQQIVIGVPVLGTTGVKYEAEPGVKVTVGRYLGTDLIDRDHFFELTYFTADQWDESASVRGDRVDLGTQLNAVTGNLFAEFGVLASGFGNSDTMFFNDSSELHNVEANYRIRRRPRRDRMVASPDSVWQRECTPQMVPSILFGLRYVSFDNDFFWQANGIVEDRERRDLQSFSGQYFVRTNNDLVGIQTGGDLTQTYCKWSWTIRGKAGAAINWAEQDSQIIVNDNTRIHQGQPPSSRVFGDDGQSLAFIGNLGFAMSYRLTPSLTFRAGWDWMWVTGLAIAPEQLDFADSAPFVNDGGDLTFQGVSFGLDARW